VLGGERQTAFRAHLLDLNHFDELDPQGITHRAVRRLQALGYLVTLEEVSA
jgi:hypothetical protein